SIGQKDEDMFYRENINNIDNIEERYKEYKIYTNNKLRDIKKDIAKLSEIINQQKLEKTTLCELFLELKYFVKHAAFKEEQECRIISVERITSNGYIDYLAIEKEYIDKVYFGPVAKGFDSFKKICQSNGLEKVLVEKCDYPFK
ncbi:MAG TPA: DUF2971 domain-containing protein, partial [Paludibacter sp.]|nr:DUF2971 domain-containing protein [Paludibacter sp.]